MNSPLPIPPDYRTLIGLLRCAVKRTPPEGDLLTAADWPATLRLARQHGVDTYLYPWLAEHAPSLFSIHADVPSDSAPAAWRTRFLEAMPLTLLRQRQLAEILEALARARIDVIPLKGAWLSETIYDDPVQRSMSDLDLLIRADDLNSSHALFLALGYTAKREAPHSTFSYDLVYRHATQPFMVELHWHFTSERTPNAPVPNICAIWARSTCGILLGQPVRFLTPEDQLAHLIQHLIHHSFALPLRGYLDLALLLTKQRETLDTALFEAVNSDWQVGRGFSFLAEVVSELFALPQLTGNVLCTSEAFIEKRERALRILFTLPPARERDCAIMQAHLKHRSLFARLRLVLSRIFMPRAFLAETYPCARSVFGLPLAWLCRTRDVYVQHHAEYTFLLKPSSRNAGNLINAELRDDLVRWLLQGTKKPE